jgi:hypothetical protein
VGVCGSMGGCAASALEHAHQLALSADWLLLSLLDDDQKSQLLVR